MTATIEYRTVDKSAWPRGPWDDEPDKVQWRDEATGLPCLIHRGPSGALCGYVGVSPGHPWHGVDYDDVGLTRQKPGHYDPDWYVDVHGGLTFSAGCAHGPDPSTGICHIPDEGETDDVWWLGFDCAHWQDMSGMAWNRDGCGIGFQTSIAGGAIYRDIAYVRAECAKLAAQAASVAAAA